jgi:hypothetical protein
MQVYIKSWWKQISVRFLELIKKNLLPQKKFFKKQVKNFIKPKNEQK